VPFHDVSVKNLLLHRDSTLRNAAVKKQSPASHILADMTGNISRQVIKYPRYYDSADKDGLTEMT